MGPSHSLVRRCTPWQHHRYAYGLGFDRFTRYAHLMQQPRYPAKAVVAGLLMAQIVATLQVYLANAELYETLLLLQTHGYLLVPGQLIAERLGEFKPAFIGGLFFTCSIGAGLTVVALAATWCWGSICNRNRAFGAMAIVFWLALLVPVNQQGFSPIPSLYVLAVPLVTVAATLRWLCPAKGTAPGAAIWVHTLPVLVLAVLWGAQWRPSMFQDIRDHLLLSNPAGIRFTEMYYRYTLYPARVFKTIEQKMLKTVRLRGFRDPAVQHSVARVLGDYDYLPTADSDRVDVIIAEEGNRLVFYSGPTMLLEMTHERFMANPLKELRAFSSKADTHRFFRQVTVLGLLFGFPLLLYTLYHSVARFVLALFLTDQRASIASTGTAFCVGLAVLLVLSAGDTVTMARKDIAASLDSARWQDQVSALKAIAASGTAIEAPNLYAKLSASTHIPVRYWLAVALGNEPGEETLEVIIDLLDDSSPNVVCKAFTALGKRGNQTHIGLMLRAIERSDHWYVQSHAYSALRALGWRQARSD